MTVSRRTLISGLAPAALQLTAGAAWSKGHRLQLSAAYGDGIFHTQNLRNFAARVGADTRQSLEIEVVSGSALKPMAQVLPALKRNDLQFGEVLMSSCADIHPLLAMDSLPFMVRGFDEAARLWQLTRPVLQEFLLAQQGAPIIELVALDELARDKVYEFAFIGGPLKIRGGDAAPLRPVALPVRP